MIDFRLHHGAVVGARARERKAAAGNAAAGEIDGIANAEPAKQLRYLVGPPQSAADPFLHRQRGDVFVEKADTPRGRHEVAGDGVEQRRLAGAVGADHRPPFAGGDFHADAGERYQRAEVPCHAFEFERMRSRLLQTRGNGHFGHRQSLVPSGYGQLGLSRLAFPSARKSASGIPSVWFTCGMTLISLL